MKERVRVFTHASGEGSIVLGTELEDHINDWLRANQGTLVNVTQSECQRSNSTHHTTVCVWYIPDETSEEGQR